MFRSTIVVLVLLRLAIGWHFFFEGLEKLRSMQIGPAESNRPFSSAGYFREPTGPLGPAMRGFLGDPYEEARERLIPRPMSEGRRPENLARFMPPLLNQEWDDYLDRFMAFYKLDDQEKETAQTRLDQAKSAYVTWVNHTDKSANVPEKEKIKQGVKVVKKAYPGGTIDVEQTVPERVIDYLTALDEVKRSQARLWYFGKDVEKQRLTKAKADLEQKRADLMKEVDEKTADMKKSLADVLTPAQAEMGAMPPAPVSWRLRFLDVSTAWGLTILGAFLLLGLLTRLSSLLLAGFLLMTYLVVPAFPWLPVPPNSEGNYYYVNKNLIEMLALLALATVPSGRWLGLDALLRAIRVALFGEPKKPDTTAGTPTTLTAHA